MNVNARAAWDDERRWDYSHGLLSLECVAPLYDYIGIPFQGDAAGSFIALLRDYFRVVYLERPSPPFTLADKQARLLRAIDNAYNSDWREEYVKWLLHVFVYKAGEHMEGWAEWRTIIMRCSVRSGWWQRLRLPPEKDEAIRQELDDAKMRNDDARDIAREYEGRAPSAWDKSVMDRMGIDQEAIQAGEPFNRIILTADFFLFYLFWVQLLKLLSPEEAERLWKNAQVVARDLNIKPEDVPRPGSLQIFPQAS